jgi:hypothetical protein
MATRFISYVPKPTKEKHSNKPLCKNMLKEFSTFDDSKQIERNPMPIRVSAVDSDFLMQKVNGDDGIMDKGILTQYILSCLILMQLESLTVTETCKSSDNGNEDVYDDEFPPFQRSYPITRKISELNQA